MGIIKNFTASVAKMLAPSVSPYIQDWLNDDKKLSKLGQLKTYKGIVKACVSAIAEEVGRTEIIVLDQKGERIENHPVISLLNNPNPLIDLSKFNLLEMTETHKQLTGESFWYLASGEVTKKPKLIYVIRPDRMATAINKETGEITGYVYTRPDNGEKMPYERHEIIHHKMPHPLSVYEGLGNVSAGEDYIKTEQNATDYTKNFIANNATPPGIVNIKNQISDQDFKDVQRKWNVKYGGTGKAGKIGFLRNADIEYVKLGGSLGDIAIKEVKDMSRDDIMFMFRVSKTILGITEDVNLANAKVAERVFLKRVIKPQVERLVDTLNTQLAPIYGNITFDFVDPISDDLDEKAQIYEKLVNSVYTLNEAREEFSLDPIENGDSLYLPLNMIAVGQVIPQKKKVLIKRTITKITESEKEDIKAPEPEIQDEETKNLIYWKSIITIRDTWLRKYDQLVDKLLKEQQKEIISRINPKKDVSGWLFDEEQEANKWYLTLVPLYLSLLNEIGIEAGKRAGIDFTLSSALEKSIRSRINQVCKDFNTETKNIMSKTLIEGIKNGDSSSQLASRVEKEYKKTRDYRADRLARTETINASNAAALDAYKQNPYITHKRWYANPSACEICASMDGTTVELEANFLSVGDEVHGINGGVMPVTFEDIQYPSMHPNCECTIIPETIEGK